MLFWRVWPLVALQGIDVSWMQATPEMPSSFNANGWFAVLAFELLYADWPSP